MGYMYPIPKGTRISQLFGTNPGGVNPSGGHTGIDYACPIGTPVYAPADGVIVLEGWMTDPTGRNNPWGLTDGGGIVIVLDAGDTKPTFIFAHLNASIVNNGQRVRKGDLIGRTGNTGKWTTGPHLHFETILPGWSLNTPTLGRSNPANVCDHYKEDLLKPAGSTTGGTATRKVTTQGANVRTAPYSDAPKAPGYPDGLALGATIAVVGYVKGQDVTGKRDDAWFKTKSGYYVWANAAGNSLAGLKYLGEVKRPAPAPKPAPKPAPAPAPAPKPAPAPAPAPKPAPAPAPKPAPAPAPEPAPAGYTFTAASPLVTEIHPAAEGKFQRGNMPATVTGLVVHQFIAGDKRFDVHLDSVIHTFTEGERVASAHFGVEGKRVVQFVDLKDRAYHAGPAGNDHWSIEVYGGMDAETLATVALLIFDLQKLAGRPLELFRHRQLMATQCGDDVPLEALRKAVADLADPATPSTPDVVQPTPPSPVPGVTVEEKEAIIREFMEKLIDEVLDDTK
ncbi:tail length tape measure protein [Arthrobacter phage Reedo]|uniref:Endolysin n=1 Tax=Arthrobacter phage Reedo TaxID=2910755 RepID=A0AA49BPB9_9CAUD|nr:tail length tape measure protein [Arthrobacter phage Reedo]UJQ86849.1 endolysin [Arthrobacter phage Reedo]